MYCVVENIVVITLCICLCANILFCIVLKGQSLRPAFQRTACHVRTCTFLCPLCFAKLNNSGLIWCASSFLVWPLGWKIKTLIVRNHVSKLPYSWIFVPFILFWKQCVAQVLVKGKAWRRLQGIPAAGGMPVSLALSNTVGRQAPLSLLLTAFSCGHQDTLTKATQVGERIYFGWHFQEILVSCGRKAWCQECEAPGHILAGLASRNSQILDIPAMTCVFQ